jgi:hypothetical protein
MTEELIDVQFALPPGAKLTVTDIGHNGARARQAELQQISLTNLISLRNAIDGLCDVLIVKQALAETVDVDDESKLMDLAMIVVQAQKACSATALDNRKVQQ